MLRVLTGLKDRTVSTRLYDQIVQKVSRRYEDLFPVKVVILFWYPRPAVNDLPYL